MRGKRWRAWLFCAVLLAALAGGNPGRARAGSAAAGTNELLPSKRYLTAYESMATADRMQEREMNEDAAVLYDEALRLFRQLASDYPIWQTNLVAFRINYCQEELNKALNLKKPVRDRPNAIKETARPSESLRSAEPAGTAGATNEVAGRTRLGEASLAELGQAGGAWVREAGGLEQAGDFKGALELYKAVLEQDKQHRAALDGAGRCFLRLGLVDEARDLLFQWCLVPSPDNSTNLLLALILCHDRQYSKAIQLIEIVLNEDNSNAAAHVILGVALAGMGRTDPAISEMQKALFLNPRLSEAHYNLAGLLLKKEPGKSSTAAAYYLNALKFGAAPDPALARLLQK